jgi:hypothetical protein
MSENVFDLIRDRSQIETTSEHFFWVLNAGTSSTNMLLRRRHNYATGIRWLPWLAQPKRRWPIIRAGSKHLSEIFTPQQQN